MPNLRATKTERVLEYLREAIARGTIAPGQPIREQELATALGVSRTPVREALRRAQIAGLIQYVAYRGVKVSELSVEDMVELYRIRSLLEPFATKLATPRLTATHFAELDRLHLALQQLAGSDAVDQMRYLNDQWHDLIYQAAGSPRLVGLINAVIAGCPRDTFSIPGRLTLTLHEHAQILTALRCRDGDLAAALMEGHILSAVASFLAVRRASASAEPAA
ncbi:MAG: GntR family transcriptional regulator [Dehalococcoidia bacterium]|nr:MAG: GntR family transcriptional regulator [Dehalococcoidia bacterium]